MSVDDKIRTKKTYTRLDLLKFRFSKSNEALTQYFITLYNGFKYFQQLMKFLEMTFRNIRVMPISVLHRYERMKRSSLRSRNNSAVLIIIDEE